MGARPSVRPAAALGRWRSLSALLASATVCSLVRPVMTRVSSTSSPSRPYATAAPLSDSVLMCGTLVRSMVVGAAALRLQGHPVDHERGLGLHLRGLAVVGGVARRVVAAHGVIEAERLAEVAALGEVEGVAGRHRARRPSPRRRSPGRGRSGRCAAACWRRWPGVCSSFIAALRLGPSFTSFALAPSPTLRVTPRSSSSLPTASNHCE